MPITSVKHWFQSDEQDTRFRGLWKAQRERESHTEQMVGTWLVQVVIDEKQFKDAGRMLAAHLADPEVEVCSWWHTSPHLASQESQICVCACVCVRCSLILCSDSNSVGLGWEQGVYETKLPLALHALLQLGCVCMVDPKARNRTIKQGWSLNDLRMKTTTECPYLIDNLPFFFLYHRLLPL
jgi:DNA polymerase epsilon subunit 1